VQDAVDAKAHQAEVALGFQMDVGGALVERVLPQPVDDMDDVLIVGIDLLVELAEFDQLLEIVAQRQILAVRLACALDRFGQAEELADVLGDVERVGDHQPHAAARNLGDLRLPVKRVRLGGCNHQFCRRQLYRQDVEAGRVSGRHHVGHPGEVDLQRVDAEKRHFDLAGHPFAQPIQRQHPVRRQRCKNLALRYGRQRMHGAGGIPENRLRLVVAGLDAALVNDAVGQQPCEDMLQVELFRGVHRQGSWQGE